MSTYVNLMSHRARLRQSFQDRMKLWLRALVIVVSAVGIHALVTWWPLYAQRLDLEALEQHYQPLQEKKFAIGKLMKRIATTEEHFGLEIAISEDTPVLTLIGLLGESVSESQGQVFLENIDYQLKGSILNPAESSEQVIITGIGADPWAVQALTESLRTALPSSLIEVRESETIEINRKQMQSFRIDCLLSEAGANGT